MIVTRARRPLQAGRSPRGRRAAPLLHIVPLSSTRRGYASEIDQHNGLAHASSAQCQHVRAVAASRLGQPYGNIETFTLTRIREVLGLILDVV